MVDEKLTAENSETGSDPETERVTDQAAEAASASPAGDAPSGAAETSGGEGGASASGDGVEAGDSSGAEEADVNELGFTPEEMVDEDDDEEAVELSGDEDASPIEEMVDEEAEPASGEDLEKDWYILKVQVNREKSICDALMRRVKMAGYESYFGDILVPTEDVREYTKSGKQRIVKRKLYPGYIVVHMAITDESWFLVRETPGIGDFTGSAGKPAPLSEEEISRIISTTRPEEDEEGEEKVKIGIKFKVGDQVRVKEGYFQNYEGEVSSIDERNGRITVMINIFGRLNPVELDHWHVEDV